MPVRVRDMTREEFEAFCRWSVANHAKELMEESHLSGEAAMNEAEMELARMLPKGLETAHNHLMTVEETQHQEPVGFLWTLHEETAGRRQSFLCDFAIWENHRRKGYGKAALELMEQRAAAAGCAESVLFVAERNRAARGLYERCGYRFLRQMEYGAYMVKQLI